MVTGALGLIQSGLSLTACGAPTQVHFIGKALKAFCQSIVFIVLLYFKSSVGTYFQGRCHFVAAFSSQFFCNDNYDPFGQYLCGL